MIRRGGLVVVLAASACRRPAPAVVAPPAPSPPAHATEVMKVVDDRVELLARVPAYDAAAAHGRVFALATDRASVSAFDFATGAKSWTQSLTGELPTKMVASFGPSKRLVLYGQGAIFAIDSASGAIVKESEGAYSEPRIEEENGACLTSDRCSVQMLDCDDAHPYGPRLSIAVTHLYKKIGEPHDNVCWGPLLVLGRAKNVVVAVTDGRTWDKQEAPITVAIDTTSGKTAWESRAHGCQRCASEASGVASDGSTCFISDVDGKLDVFACATGQSLFAKKLELGSERPEIFATWADGVFVSAKRASLFDAKTGAARWTIDLPADGIALPLGTKLDLPKFSTWGAHTVLLVDPKSGKEIVRFAQPAYTEIVQADDLGLRLVGGPSFDAKGEKRAFVGETFTLDREHLPRVLLAKGKKLLEVETDLAIVEQSIDHVAMYVWGRKGTAGSLVIAKLQ
ncbi:MAG: outer membrane protein assembly factor BamB family protein [Polyangiales bacterium]